MLNRMSREACPRVGRHRFRRKPVVGVRRARKCPDRGRAPVDSASSPLAGAHSWSAHIWTRDFLLREPVGSSSTAGRYPEVWSTPLRSQGPRRRPRVFLSTLEPTRICNDRRSRARGSTRQSLSTQPPECVAQIHLTAESDWEAFRWWVEINRAPSPVAETTPYIRVRSGVRVGLASCEDEILPVSETVFRAMLRQIDARGVFRSGLSKQRGIGPAGGGLREIPSGKRDSLLTCRRELWVARHVRETLAKFAFRGRGTSAAGHWRRPTSPADAPRL